MHPLVAHKWACVVLLCGLSTTLALPFGDDDNLFASGPSDDLNTFSSDTIPIDGSYGDLSQDSGDYFNFGGDPLLGFDGSAGAGFDLAYKVGDCKYGDVVSEAGSVSHPGCPDAQPYKGCERSGGATVYPFDDRLANLCAPQNQKCCGTNINFDSLGQCDTVAQPYGIGEWFSDFINGVFPGSALAPSSAGAGAGSAGTAGAGMGGLINPKKRSADFCPADIS